MATNKGNKQKLLNLDTKLDFIKLFANGESKAYFWHWDQVNLQHAPF